MLLAARTLEPVRGARSGTAASMLGLSRQLTAFTQLSSPVLQGCCPTQIDVRASRIVARPHSAGSHGCAKRSASTLTPYSSIGRRCSTLGKADAQWGDLPSQRNRSHRAPVSAKPLSRVESVVRHASRYLVTALLRGDVPRGSSDRIADWSSPN